MRVLLISDIHGNIFGLKTVLKTVGKVDKIICAGDITGYYPFVNEVIKELKKRQVTTVKGNHDQYLLDGKAPEDKNDTIKQSVQFVKKIISKNNFDYIQSLPESINLNVDKRKVLVFHGSPWDFLEQRIYPDYQHFDRFKSVNADLVILGHTHYPFTKNIGNLTVINPGSCGQPRDYNLLSCTVWDTKKNTFENRRLEWDIDGFKKAAIVKGVSENLFDVFKRAQKI